MSDRVGETCKTPPYAGRVEASKPGLLQRILAVIGRALRALFCCFSPQIAPEPLDSSRVSREVTDAADHVSAVTNPLFNGSVQNIETSSIEQFLEGLETLANADLNLPSPLVCTKEQYDSTIQYVDSMKTKISFARVEIDKAQLGGESPLPARLQRIERKLAELEQTLDSYPQAVAQNQTLLDTEDWNIVKNSLITKKASTQSIEWEKFALKVVQARENKERSRLQNELTPKLPVEALDSRATSQERGEWPTLYQKHKDAQNQLVKGKAALETETANLVEKKVILAEAQATLSARVNKRWVFPEDNKKAFDDLVETYHSCHKDLVNILTATPDDLHAALESFEMEQNLASDTRQQRRLHWQSAPPVLAHYLELRKSTAIAVGNQDDPQGQADALLESSPELRQWVEKDAYLKKIIDKPMERHKKIVELVQTLPKRIKSYGFLDNVYYDQQEIVKRYSDNESRALRELEESDRLFQDVAKTKLKFEAELPGAKKLVEKAEHKVKKLEAKVQKAECQLKALEDAARSAEERFEAARPGREAESTINDFFKSNKEKLSRLRDVEAGSLRKSIGLPADEEAGEAAFKEFMQSLHRNIELADYAA